MKYYLVIYEDNTKNFTYEGLRLLTENEYKNFQKEIEALFELSPGGLELYIHSDDCIWYDSAEVLNSTFTVHELTKEDYNTFLTVFKVKYFGAFPDIEDQLIALQENNSL
jgi:hypothetical protein